MVNALVRLSTILVEAGLPVIGVDGNAATGHLINIDWRRSPTAAEIAKAETIVTAFDWSASADAAWERDRARASAKERLDEAASAAEIKLLKAILGLLVDEINTLRGLHGLPARTVAQVRTAIAAKLDSGAAD